MNKKMAIIIILSILMLGLIYLLYNLFGVNIQIKLNYGVNIPIADTKIYYCHDEIGRDTNYYHVVKYNSKKIKRIKKLHWTKQLEQDNEYYENLLEWLKNNNIKEEYYPVIDEDTLYFKKTFENKLDYLLIIYNTNTNIINIYEFHI